MKWTLLILLFVLPILVLPSILFAQNSAWYDGKPSFNKTYESILNVDFEPLSQSFATLSTSYSQIAEPDGMRYLLNGIRWQWPFDQNKPETFVLSAEDVETYAQGDQILYVVVDGAGKKVVVLRLSDNRVLRAFDAPVGNDLHLENPADVELFTENNQLKLLITDMGRHRVIKVDYITKMVEWQYGISDLKGKGKNQLDNPMDAVKIPGKNEYLICDQGNNRIVWVNAADTSIVWQWGSNELNIPVDVEYLSAIHAVLITDQNNDRVIIVDRNTNSITWQYSDNTVTSLDDRLSAPVDADLLPDGNILITDAGNSRIIEVTPTNPPRIVWDARKRFAELQEADRIVSNDPLMNNQVLFIAEETTTGYIIPFRLGYQSAILESDPRNAGLPVNFDSLFFSGIEDPGITDVKIQMRSAATELDLAIANWYGPIGESDYYEAFGMPINPIHDGDQWYQFRFLLETNSVLLTPVATDLKVSFHYFTDKIGALRTGLIGSGSGTKVTRWRNLEVNAIYPPKQAYHSLLVLHVNILSAQGQKLAIFNIGSAGTHQFELHRITTLQGVEQVKLEIEFQSFISAFSPVLDDIKITWDSVPTSVVDDSSAIPQYYTLEQNYPNPFNGSTSINYTLPAPELVSLKVFNLWGQEITALVNGRQTAGEHTITWDATDTPSGVYIYRLQAGAFSATKKLLLVK